MSSHRWRLMTWVPGSLWPWRNRRILVVWISILLSPIWGKFFPIKFLCIAHEVKESIFLFVARIILVFVMFSWRMVVSGLTSIFSTWVFNWVLGAWSHSWALLIDGGSTLAIGYHFVGIGHLLISIQENVIFISVGFRSHRLFNLWRF